MNQVIVGKIVNTHGIKGELKVKASTDLISKRGYTLSGISGPNYRNDSCFTPFS